MNKGFTLVETIVALLVLVLGITGILFITTRNINAAFSINNEIIASNLVQEGVEVVRNIRDTAILQSQTQAGALPDGSYRVQWNSVALMPLSGNSPLLFDSASGLYSYDSGLSTKFKRRIDISSAQGGEEKIVAVSVSWTERGINKSISAEEHLFNF